MQPNPIRRRPLLPNTRILPRRPVSRTRDVAKYTIEMNRAALYIKQVGHDARVEVGNHERGGGQARELVHE